MDVKKKEKKLVGILGYGKVGQILVERILTEGDRLGLQLAFVWNRSSICNKVPSSVAIVEQLQDIEKFQIDLIVEVCHPNVINQNGEFLLKYADLLIGSTTALADDECYERLNQAAITFNRRILLARGALWGGNDIQRMARQNMIESVRIKMTFHPESLRLGKGPMKLLTDKVNLERDIHSNSRVLYEGSVRQLCKLAPNNVNTMATAALLGIGFDRTIGCLVADRSLVDHHRIEIEVIGSQTVNAQGDKLRPFQVKTIRLSPTSKESNVSSNQTIEAFWQSILESITNDDKIQVC